MQPDPADFLAASRVIDFDHPAVAAKAAELRGTSDDPVAITAACFAFVRDAIPHSVDIQAEVVPCTASEVLAAGTGYCYAKSHLLAALLRSNEIPTALVYQRLSLDDIGPPFILHGLNAVHLPGIGWHRIDARGNKPGLETVFDPTHESLAYPPKLPGEATLPGLYADPLPVVEAALTDAPGWRTVIERRPDIEPQTL